MRRLFRVMLIAFAPAALTACGTSGGGGWDGVNSLSDSLSDMVHDFNPLGASKKPLPGERRPVFPEGVPGVQQGVPAEMVRGNQPAAQQTAATPEPGEDAAPAPAAAPKSTKTVRRARSTTAIEPRQSDPPPDDDVWPPLPKQ